MKSQLIYKNAPFDVCESRLENTFFNSWDQIKHNIIVNWVDLYDKTTNHGLALFSDHTTTYAHGEDHPLALTVAYSGGGLFSWGRNFDITRPTEISYSIIPHAGTWKESRIWSEGERINEPLLATMTSNNRGQNRNQSNSFLNVQDNAYELSSIVCKGNDVYIRFFNAQSDALTKSVTFNLKSDRAELVELNGEVREVLKLLQIDGKIKVNLSIPQFGIRTIKLANATANN
jgi:alpha-mannosidase